MENFDWNGTVVMIMFGSSLVEERFEEEAFSIGDLVSEFGGILGLFIGFNFLMVFDFAVILIAKIRPLRLDKYTDYI